MSNTNIKISQLQRGEHYPKRLQEAAEILSETLYEGYIDPKEMTYSIERDTTLVALNESDKVVGACIIGLDRVKKTGEAGLGAIGVSKFLQGKGVGRILLRAAENTMREHGAETSRIYVTNNAEGFYVSMGYDIEKEVDAQYMETTVYASKSLEELTS